MAISRRAGATAADRGVKNCARKREGRGGPTGKVLVMWGL